MNKFTCCSKKKKIQTNGQKKNNRKMMINMIPLYAMIGPRLLFTKLCGEENITTRMGFEPTRAEPIGLAVQRLNHSATSSVA